LFLWASSLPGLWMKLKFVTSAPSCVLESGLRTMAADALRVFTGSSRCDARQPAISVLRLASPFEAAAEPAGRVGDGTNAPLPQSIRGSTDVGEVVVDREIERDQRSPLTCRSSRGG
jgi:hypothetical protein